MIMLILYDFLFFCAGVFFHMSIVHFFCFSETASHPMIRIWKNPRLASSISGVIQLFFGLLIILLLKYQFELNFNTLFLFVGFSFWGILRGFHLEKK
jgi:hypothetical protein